MTNYKFNQNTFLEDKSNLDDFTVGDVIYSSRLQTKDGRRFYLILERTNDSFKVLDLEKLEYIEAKLNNTYVVWAKAKHLEITLSL